MTSRGVLLSPPAAATTAADGAAAVAAYRVVGDAAVAALADARRAGKGGQGPVVVVPPAVAPAMWGGVGAGVYLAWLRAAGWDPWDEALRRRVEALYPARLGLALLRRRLFGGF